MDWKVELLMASRAMAAAFLGGLIGLERQWHGREAGVRTYAAVSLGASVYALISDHLTTGNNPHVISAGVVSGIGFLGAGVIIRHHGNIAGLTTAATLWASASMGLAIGYGVLALGMLVALLIFALLASHHVPGWERFASGARSATSHATPVAEPTDLS